MAITENTEDFTSTVWEYYRTEGRELPWRRAESDGRFDPYKILVSELMLQQTQANRVIPKYHDFLATFPSLSSLAEAPLATVLRLWSGLGYNRRAKYLQEAARSLYGQPLPWSIEQLTACKGIGYNTAAAIRVYTWNHPEVFVETNIRTVYIHHFFTDVRMVGDKQIAQKLEQTLDRDNPREFYWALMDYGTHLKRSGVKASSRSKQYVKQSPFAGSRRQIRGKIIKAVTTNEEIAVSQLRSDIADERFDAVLKELQLEGFVRVDGKHVKL